MTDSNNLRFKISSDKVAAIAVALAPVLYFLPALLQSKVLCPDDDLLQNVPFRVAAAQIMRSGYLPLWNPYIFSGMPLLATAQVGILYPLNWSYLVFSPATATNLMVISTYMVAGLGAYLYARRIGASVAGAAITSLAWQFSGAAIGQISHINIIQTSAILPWVLWSLEGYAAKGTFKRGALRFRHHRDPILCRSPTNLRQFPFAGDCVRDRDGDHESRIAAAISNFFCVHRGGPAAFGGANPAHV